MVKNYRNYSKTMNNPKRPYEKERIDNELLLLGTYGLKNKREIWRVQYTLARIRKAARTLLTLPENHPRRAFEGGALIRRMTRLGVLNREQQKLDFVLGLTTQQFMDRRLQTIAWSKTKAATSVHHARTLIFQRKISIKRANRQNVINVPSYLVRTKNESYIKCDTTVNEGSRTMKRSQKRREEKANNQE